MRLVDVTGADWRTERELMLNRHRDGAVGCTGADCVYAAHRDGRVDSFVHVSKAKVRATCVEEAAWVEEIAQLHDLDLVMIAGIDPGRGGAEILADLEELGASESFRGVRMPLGVPAYLPFVDGLLEWLAERELVVEISPLAEQVAGWVKALERHPEIVSVVGYDGWVIEPRGAVTDEWRRAFSTYADGNVDRWQVTLPHDGRVAAVTWPKLQPWLETAAEILGWERLMFASTLPLETSAMQYPRLLAGIEEMLAGVSEEDRERFWSENAAAAYRM
ncbi:amidohydrolase family protein [Nocardioides sp.]|uniref:amidohydrolase family protein n=1 Tax=Nocardioides sp. TaxID=35761 RepID=UPI00263312C2|nr:amidohydrolase family protein [Nocardioides sp.]